MKSHTLSRSLVLSTYVVMQQCSHPNFVTLFVLSPQEGVGGPNYNLSGKLTEYSNTYKVGMNILTL